MEIPVQITDENEKLAYQTIQLYNDAVSFYAPLTQSCTKATCPKMVAGVSTSVLLDHPLTVTLSNFEYQWADEVIKTPIAVSAPEYMDYLFLWIQAQLTNPTFFPTKPEQPFPKDFKPRLVNMLRRLLRVWAHLWWTHLNQLTSADREKMNLLMKRFLIFVKKEQLVSDKELAVLADVIKTL